MLILLFIIGLFLVMSHTYDSQTGIATFSVARSYGHDRRLTRLALGGLAVHRTRKEYHSGH
jgi:hypothetical protein